MVNVEFPGGGKRRRNICGVVVIHQMQEQIVGLGEVGGYAKRKDEGNFGIILINKVNHMMNNKSNLFINKDNHHHHHHHHQWGMFHFVFEQTYFLYKRSTWYLIHLQSYTLQT